jgi:hypothetical protein
MTVDETLQIVQALSGLTVTGLLFLILITGHRGKWSFEWVAIRERELATKTEQRLEAQIEIERKDKNEWKALALKVTGLAEATVDLAKQKGGTS